DGAMYYALMVISGLLLFGALAASEWHKRSEDLDGNGIPDWRERREREIPGYGALSFAQWEWDRREAERMANQPAPSTDRNYRTMTDEEYQRWQRGESPASKPRVTWRGGRRVDPGAPVVEPKDSERSH
ncbi:MAG: hypothetical protein L0219_06020, partial [Phycisphaerales bacterium]|nr:hypothetical protein [Phycisphaerales bacterium]